MSTYFPAIRTTQGHGSIHYKPACWNGKYLCLCLWALTTFILALLVLLLLFCRSMCVVLAACLGKVVSSLSYVPSINGVLLGLLCASCNYTSLSIATVPCGFD